MKEHLDLFNDAKPVEFGTEAVEMVPLDAVVSLAQIRQSYDLEKLDELAARIPSEVKDGSLHFYLINPTTVAKFTDPEALIRYLHEHGLYYSKSSFETEETINEDDHLLPVERVGGVHIPEAGSIDITSFPEWEGARYVRINGHRRSLAIRRLCEMHGVDERNALVSSTILVNPSFEQGRRDQYMENTFDSVPLDEDALAVEREYNYRWPGEDQAVDAETYNVRLKILSDFMGYSVETTRSRLRFASMPKDIKKFYDKGLSYGNIVGLARIREAYENKFEKQMAVQKMQDYFEGSIYRLLTGKSNKHISDNIQGKLKELMSQTDYDQGELFLVDEVSDRKQRQVVRKRIADAAILALSIMPSLTKEQLAELKKAVPQLLGEDIEAAAEVDPDQSLF